jgi:hypothetical protein
VVSSQARREQVAFACERGVRVLALELATAVAGLVPIQLKWPKVWYPALWKEVRDGQDLAVAPAAPQ